MPIYKQDGKKNGLQKYRVIVSFTDRNGEYRQISRTTYGREEAKQLETELRARSLEAASGHLTVDELIAEYLAAQKGNIRATTYDKYKRNLELYVSPTLGNLKISKLSSQLLQKWKTSLNERGLSTVTKTNAYRNLSAVLNFGVRMEYFQKNPLAVIGGFRDPDFTVEAERLRFYTADQFLSFISAARADAEAANDWRFYVFFNIAFYTGMRKGEIHALKWSDLEGNILHVRRSITQKLKGGDVETPPKNKSSYRDLQMPAPLLEVLAAHRQRCQHAPSFSEDWRICGGEAPLRDNTLSNKNNKYASAAGLPHISIHEFRHTHASLLINEGISIQEIARRLGHSDVQVTWKTYAHLYPREEERAVHILDRISLQNAQ